MSVEVQEKDPEVKGQRQPMLLMMLQLLLAAHRSRAVTGLLVHQAMTRRQAAAPKVVAEAAVESRPSSVDAALTSRSASEIVVQCEGSRSDWHPVEMSVPAAHVKALRQKLAECQQSRDLLLSCLLYEVLRRFT